MATSSVEKWPVALKITRVASSTVNELELFLVSGVMNRNQAATVSERLPVLSECEFEKDRFALSTLVNRPQLQKIYEDFLRLSKEYRGQYYAVTNKFVEVCRPFFEA